MVDSAGMVKKQTALQRTEEDLTNVVNAIARIDEALARLKPAETGSVKAQDLRRRRSGQVQNKIILENKLKELRGGRKK